MVARVGEQRTAPTVDVGVRPSNEVLEQIYAAVPPQPRHLGMVLAGDRERAGWWGRGRHVDAADVIALAHSVGAALGVPLSARASATMPFHPGRCAEIMLADGTVVGHAGELHPKVIASLGLSARTVAAELDLDVLTIASEGSTAARTLVTSPLAYQDLALVVADAVPAAALEASLRRGAGEQLESATLFDVYRGDQVGAGRKSLAYRLVFRAPDRTLTTDEVTRLRDQAVAAAASDHQAVQRT